MTEKHIVLYYQSPLIWFVMFWYGSSLSCIRQHWSKAMSLKLWVAVNFISFATDLLVSLKKKYRETRCWSYSIFKNSSSSSWVAMSWLTSGRIINFLWTQQVQPRTNQTNKTYSGLRYTVTTALTAFLLTVKRLCRESQTHLPLQRE